MKFTVKLKYATITNIAANLLEVKQYVADLIAQGHTVLEYTYEYKQKPHTVDYSK